MKTRWVLSLFLAWAALPGCPTTTSGDDDDDGIEDDDVVGDDDAGDDDADDDDSGDDDAEPVDHYWALIELWQLEDVADGACSVTGQARFVETAAGETPYSETVYGDCRVWEWDLSAPPAYLDAGTVTVSGLQGGELTYSPGGDGRYELDGTVDCGVFDAGNAQATLTLQGGADVAALQVGPFVQPQPPFPYSTPDLTAGAVSLDRGADFSVTAGSWLISQQVILIATDTAAQREVMVACPFMASPTVVPAAALAHLPAPADASDAWLWNSSRGLGLDSTADHDLEWLPRHIERAPLDIVQ